MVKNLPAKARDIREAGLIPGSGRSLGGGHNKPLQYSCLEKNPRDSGAWGAKVHRVAKSQTRLKRLSTHALRSELLLSRQVPVPNISGEMTPLKPP